MAQTVITGQIKTTNQALMKEDVSDIIYNISPTDTPFMSSCKRGSTKNTLFQWNLDKLADAAIGVGIAEGQNPATPLNDALKVPQEKNFTQIFRKLVETSGTIEAVDLYGRKSEMAYQMAKKSQEIKRDIEKTLLGLSNALVPGQMTAALGALNATAGQIESSADPRVTRNFANIVDTNQLIDTTSAATIAATSTVVNAGGVLLTIDIFDKVMERMWTIGADFDFAIPTPAAMEAIARFAVGGQTSATGLSGRFRDSGQAKKLVNVVDVYVSPFGEVSMVLDRFMPVANVLEDGAAGNVIYFIDPKQLELKYLRGFSTMNLAKTGDAERKMILAELGLVVKAPQGCGVLFNFSLLNAVP